MNKIVIRALQIEDLENEKNGFFEILNRLSPTLKDKNLEQVIKEFGESSENNRCFVALINDKIVGTVTFWINKRIPRGGQKIALIEDLVVDKGHEGKGIGGELINWAMKFAKESGCGRVRLVCKPELKSFYGKFGFHEDGISMRLDL